MATSQYSILRQYQPYVSPYNLDLIKDVMLYKQGKVDVNRERINQQIDLLMGQTIAKPEARAYFENKMSGVLNRVNDMYRGADLSSDGVVRHIQGEISEVLDDTVINAIAGTKAGQQMMDYIHEVQVNDSDKYSAMNAYNALKPYYNWLNDGQAGSRLAPLNYTPYTDYNKELRDNMQAIMKSHKGTTYQVPVTDKDGNPTGVMMEVTRDAMTPQQVADAAMAGLSSNARVQMQIEAEYLADSNPQAFSLSAMMGYTQQMISQQDQYIKYLNAEIMGAGSDTNKEALLKNELNKAKSDLAYMQQSYKNLSSGSYSPVVGAAMVVENNFKQNAANMYAYDNSTMKMDKDPVYWAKKDYDEKVRGNNIRLEIARSLAEYRNNVLRYNAMNDEADRDLKMKSLEIQRLKAMNAAAGNSGGGRSGSRSVSLEGLRAGTSGTVSTGAINTDDIDIEKWHSDKFNDVYSRLTSNSVILQNTIGSDNMGNINGYINIKMSDPTSGYGNLSKDEQVLKYIKENGGLSNPIFDNLSSEERTRAVAAYQAALQAERDMDVINDRLNEEDAIRNTKNESLLPAVVNFLHTNDSETIGKFMTQKVMDSFESAWGVFGESVVSGVMRFIPGGSLLGPLYDTYRTNRNRTYTASELDKLQRELDSVKNVMDENGFDGSGYFGENLNIYDWVRQNENGDYYIVSSDSAPDAVKVLSGKDYTLNGRDISDRVHEFFGIGLYADLERNAEERVMDVKRKYIDLQSNPIITFNLSVSSTSPEYYESSNVRKLYETKSGIGLDTATSITVQKSSLKGDDGGDIYVLTPIGKSKNGADYEPIEVSSSDLGRYVNIGEGGDAIDVGGYDSGMRSLSFSKATQTWYPRMLQARGYDPMYANTESVLKYLTDPLTQYGTGFNDSAENPDPRRAVLIRAAQTILNNYNKFNIRVKGYDDFGMGYNVYLYGVENGERPEELMSYTSPTTAYADSIDSELGVAPQIQFVNFLNAAISEELEAMILGSQGIRPNGNLAKMLNFANN